MRTFTILKEQWQREKESAEITVSSQGTESENDVAAVNEQVVSTNTQSATKENVQTTAENQDNFEGGLHTGLDQSGSGLESDFQAEKSDTSQMAAESDVNDQSLSTNAQLENKEDVLTVAENLSLAGGHRINNINY